MKPRPNNGILFQPAVKTLNSLLKKEVSAEEVLNQHLAQIERVNPKINAIVQQDLDVALQKAKQADTIIC